MRKAKYYHTYSEVSNYPEYQIYRATCLERFRLYFKPLYKIEDIIDNRGKGGSCNVIATYYKILDKKRFIMKRELVCSYRGD